MSQLAVITGVAGFIGSHLARALLRREVRVLGIDNLDPFYEPALKMANIDAIMHDAPDGQFEFVEADVRDEASMAAQIARARPDCLFHIAAMAGVRPSIADPLKYVDVNVRGLVSVLEAVRAAGCGRVVFASSSSVYGNNRSVPFAEDDPVEEPISPYAATKRSGELICRTYCHLHGLRIAALRFFTVYGPAQRPDLAIGSFMRRIAHDDEVLMYGDGSSSRDYTFIDDIITGVLAAADKLDHEADGFNRIYNLGGSDPVSLAEMIRRIGTVVGATPRIRQMPMQPGDVERTFADLTRSRSELGFEPCTPFDEGLARQWAWMRQSVGSNG